MGEDFPQGQTLEPALGRDELGSTTPPPISRAALATFLGLTLCLSAVFWWLGISGKVPGGSYILGLMWSPGTSAIVAYGTVWAAGLGAVDLSRFTTPITTFVFLGTIQSVVSATGEELGWRGFLVPALAQRFSLAKTAVISGAIWSVWHYPLIILANYNAGTSTWWAVVCFTVMVIGLSFPLAWIRLRSGSVWPAALFHASHNLFIQGFLDPVTVDTGSTLWLTTEFGAALAITVTITAWLFWRRREQVAERGVRL